MWEFFYNLLIIPFLWIGIHLLAPFNSKIRRGLRGRKDALARMEERLRNLPDEKRLLVHASSMGEFEQAKPIIEAAKERIPDLVVIASFFSPSGYENNLRYPSADYITYLPFDSRRKVRKFLDVAKPTLIAFIRYDLWPNLIWQASKKGIPIVLTNATLKKRSARRYPILRSFHHAMFGLLRAILTVSKEDEQNFSIFHLTEPHLTTIGDTRYDRVRGKTNTARQKKILPEHITAGKCIFVAGSTWIEDEDIVLPAILKLQQHIPNNIAIIVPHEPTIEHLEQLEYQLRGKTATIRLSLLHEYSGESIIIVDTIGILLSLYSYAHVAFVGGGFKSNVHNVLEPAVYGIPVLYGPKIENSQEAALLAEAGGGCIVQKKTDLYRSLRQFFSDERVRLDVGATASDFVHQRTGTTERILEHILPYFSDDSEPPVRTQN